MKADLDSIPKFKYNLDPLKLDVIKKESTDCCVCQKRRSYVYIGPFYSVEEVSGLCPWCIKDGSAAKKYDGHFQDYASIEGISPNPDLPHEIHYSVEALTELTERTPGYSGWQQEIWLGHCGEPCAIRAYVGWQEIEHLKQELEPDIEKLKGEFNLSQEQFESFLVNGGDLQGYLFQCVVCKKAQADYGWKLDHTVTVLP